LRDDFWAAVRNVAGTFPTTTRYDIAVFHPGPDADTAKSVEWFRCSAALDLPQGIYSLGQAYSVEGTR
jgi:TPR repeat protein